MNPDTEAAAGGATFYAQARAMRDSGIAAPDAQQRLQAAGMDAGRARELVESLFGSPKRVPAAPSTKVVSESSQSLGRPIAAGLAAALFGAIVWAMISAAIRYNFGIVAWGLGAAVGCAVYAATPLQHRSYEHLPWIACGMALFGIVIGQYLAFVFIAAQVEPSKVSVTDALNPAVLSYYFAHMPDIMSPLSLLWIAAAMYSAYKIAAQNR